MTLSPPDTRASLIWRLQDADDVRAWEEFVEIYSPLIHRLARQKGFQFADAEDFVQDIFSTVSKSIGPWLQRDDRGSFRAWLFTVARNYAINILTRQPHRRREVDGLKAQKVLELASVPDNDATREFDLAYRREVFHWAARQVKANCRPQTWNAFWETHVVERPIPEVAKELQMSIGNVYLARSRVMAKLQEFVEQHERQQ